MNDELIYDFIDGELPLELESEFFMQLASNTELQMRLKQMISFREAIKSNEDLFVPDPVSTSAIFNKLGFTATETKSDSDWQSEPDLRVKINRESFFRKHGAKIKWSVISSIVTAILVYLLTLNYGNNNDNLTGEKIISVKRMSDKRASDKRVSDKLIIEKVDKSGSVNESTRHMAQGISIIKDGGGSSRLSEVEIENEITNHQRINPITSKLAATEEFKWKNEDNEVSTVQSKMSSDQLNILENGESALNLPDLKFEIRGTQYWNAPEATILPGRFAKFNNNAAAVYYNISDFLSAGIEARQENFFQRFSGIDSMGVENIYEQQPNFTTYSIAARYYYNLTDNLKPVCQTAVGFNNAGQVFRLMFGMEYRMFDIVGFIAGFEYSILRYNHQDNYFTSNKYGFNYGVSVNLK